MENPLEQLREFFAQRFLVSSALVYILAVVVSFIFSPITIAPAIPFISKIFGSGKTFLLTFFAVLLGSIISFYLARTRGEKTVFKIFSEDDLKFFQTKVPKNLNFANLLFFRFFTPPDGLSYYLGLNKKVKFWKYFLTSALGLLPITFILSFGADAIGRENKLLFFLLLFNILIILFSKALYHFLHLKKVKLITHAYNFHLDDIFSVATLALFLEKRGLAYEVIRESDRDKIESYKKEAIEKVGLDEVYLLDVGGEYNPDYNFFDHHQRGGAMVRESGVPYSSFGLVWKKYGEKLCGSKEVAKKIDFDLVLGVDANDNGLNLCRPNFNFFLYGLPSLKNSFLPLSSEKEDYDEAFLKVLEIFKTVLANEIKWSEKRLNDEKKLDLLYKEADDKRVLWVEENLSLGKAFPKYPELLFLVKRRGDRWVIHSVAKDNKSKEVKKEMPESWCGLRGEELEVVSGVRGAIFCHSGGWIALVDSKASAEKMVKKLLSSEDEKK